MQVENICFEQSFISTRIGQRKEKVGGKWRGERLLIMKKMIK